MPEDTGGAAVAPDAVEELISLVRRAEAEGDAVLPEVRSFFDEHPDVATRLGDVAASARLALADLAAAGCTVHVEAFLRRAAALEAELAGPDAPPLEKVLAGHVGTCWLAACEAEITAANARAAPPPRANFLDQRRDRAGRRLEGAVKTLALVKKLLRPAVSPLDIATRAAHGRRAGARQNGRQEVPVAAGVAVAN
jgi:hypothetical protein